MKTLKTGVCALIPAVMLALAACATTPKGEEDVAVMETPDGAVIIQTFRTTAEVTAIDAEKRKVTLRTHHRDRSSGLPVRAERRGRTIIPDGQTRMIARPFHDERRESP